MSDKFWAACQTISGREHLVRSEIEKTDRGAFLPTYAKTWASNGMMNAREFPLVPGYVFFRTTQKNWGEINSIEGVCGVLSFVSDDGAKALARRVSDSEIARMTLSHALGDGNCIDYAPRARTDRKRRRRPRPSKRARSKTSRTTVSNQADSGSA